MEKERSIDIFCSRCGVIGNLTYRTGITIKGMQCSCGTVCFVTIDPQNARVPYPIEEPECKE